MLQLCSCCCLTLALTEKGDLEAICQTAKKGHGFGTRSIATFCNKNNGFYVFKAEETEFTLLLMSNQK